MEYVIGLLAALFGAVMYYKKKASDNAVEIKLIETKTKDANLKEEALELKEMINVIDRNIKNAKATREKQKEEARKENLTLSEIRDRIKKGQGIR